MSVKAIATPLAGALPGGSEGATVVVEPMIAGTVTQPRAWFERDEGRLWRLRARGFRVAEEDHWTVPVPAYLVRHPTAGNVLVDVGLHPSIRSDPRLNAGRIIARFTRPSLESGMDVPSQLRAKGVEPGEISVVVMTHLHFDHASAISEFPDATFVISAAEWEAATTLRRPTSHGYRRRHYDHLFDYRTVDFEGDAVGSYGSFGRTFDLFGDGSVRLAFTPGHSTGHQSVILRLPRRDFVVAGDVAYTWGQLEGGPEQPLSQDLHNWRRSLHELQHYHRDYPYAVIVPGHDAEFHAKLEPRYAE
ncbi:MAG: N-acyl homoserine lactonase family protein [Solirubrobacterales bacterium]|nr:N-acyl homoserine lactonase family protein [Solirubrobacterales bacterium]